MSNLAGFFMPQFSIKPLCNACNGTGSIPGMSGLPKDCPRCTYPVLTAQREARDKRRFLRAAWRHSRATGLTRFILIAMSSHVDPTGICTLRIGKLMQLCGCSERAAKDARSKLLELGEIVLIQNHGGSGIGGVYRVRNLEKGCI